MLLILFAVLYARSFPFAYHIRFAYYVLRARLAQVPRDKRRELSPFAFQSVLHFRCWPDDVDFNLHMGNSSYNKLSDFARYAHLVKMGFSGNVSGANGGIYMRFKRAIRPFEAFSLHTRVAAMNSKWVFIEHAFVVNNRVKAAGLCKIVIKRTQQPGGRSGSAGTQPPVDVFRYLGYDTNQESASNMHSKDGGKVDDDDHGNRGPGIRAGEMLLGCEKWFGKDNTVTSLMEL